MAAPGSVRALIFGFVGAFALFSAGSALGAYNPLLLVGEANPALGGTGSVGIFVQVRDQDDATGVITLYSSPGYSVKLDHPAGTEPRKRRGKLAFAVVTACLREAGHGVSARVPIRGAPGCMPSIAPSCTGASIYPPSGRFRPVRITR